MFRALRLIFALAGRRAGAYGDHAKARATHLALLAVFGFAAAGFGLALVAVALAQWLGVLAALGVLAGAGLAGCLGVLIAMRAERRAHALALAQQSDDDQRLMQAALLSALPAARRGGLVAAGLAGLALLLAVRGRGGRRD